MQNKDFEHAFTVGDVQLSARVSPCVWMYGNYPLQVQVQMHGGGVAYLRNRNKTWATAIEQDVIDLAQKVGVVPCSRCGKPAFDPSTVDTNRDGLCEACFTGDINTQIEQIQIEEAAALRKRDQEMKCKGYAYRVTAWIHPQRGDDMQSDFYFMKSPTEEEITRVIRESGSCVLDDYAPPVKL